MNERDLRQRLTEMDKTSLNALKELADRYVRAIQRAEVAATQQRIPSEAGTWHTAQAEAHLQAIGLLLNVEVREVRAMVRSGVVAQDAQTAERLHV